MFQQQVYEVKLEDGNVYVKHSSLLSLLPFPADQKHWTTFAWLLHPTALGKSSDWLIIEPPACSKFTQAGF